MLSSAESSSFNTIVIGVGNPLRHDDGVGVEIISRLLSRGNNNFAILDGGTDALSLLDKIPNFKRAIIIDAVDMRAKPGAIRVFSPNEAKINIHNDALTTHGFGLAEMMDFITRLEIKTELKIIGIQPKDISFGEGLSGEITEQLTTIITLIDENII